MISIDALLGMIATDAILGGDDSEDGTETIRSNKLKDSSHLPPIDYRLELIRKPNGTYEWVD